MEHDAPISVALTNLGKYNEGCLAFKWLDLPATTEQVQQAFREIGVDGIRYEEWFLSDRESTLAGVIDHIGEYSSLDELNYLATLVEDMAEHERDVFEAAAEYGGDISSVKDLINVAQNLEKYDLYPSVHSESDYGYYLADEGCIDIPDHLVNYFDHEAYGRDCMLEETGTLTDNGYIRDTGASITEYYDGMEVPEEYKITRYPTPKGIEQMERAGAADEKTAPAPER